MSLEIGTVVKALKGRDKDKYFCVVDTKEDFVLICDGKERKLEKPKLKKVKHIEATPHKLQTEALQVNKHIYKALRSLNVSEE